MTKKQYAKFAVVSFLFTTTFLFIVIPDTPRENIISALIGTAITVGLFRTAEWIMKP